MADYSWFSSERSNRLTNQINNNNAATTAASSNNGTANQSNSNSNKYNFFTSDRSNRLNNQINNNQSNKKPVNTYVANQIESAYSKSKKRYLDAKDNLKKYSNYSTADIGTAEYFKHQELLKEYDDANKEYSKYLISGDNLYNAEDTVNSLKDELDSYASKLANINTQYANAQSEVDQVKLEQEYNTIYEEYNNKINEYNEYIDRLTDSGWSKEFSDKYKNTNAFERHFIRGHDILSAGAIKAGTALASAEVKVLSTGNKLINTVINNPSTQETYAYIAAKNNGFYRDQFWQNNVTEEEWNNLRFKDKETLLGFGIKSAKELNEALVNYQNKQFRKEMSSKGNDYTRTSFMNDFAEINQNQDMKLQNASYGLTGLSKDVVDSMGSAAGQIIDAAVAGAMGGVIPGASGLGVMALRVFGESYANAVSNGATDGRATAYAAASAFVEYVSECLGNRFGLDEIAYGKGMTDKFADVIVKKIPFFHLKSLANRTIGATSEGAEEVFSELMSPLVEALLSDDDFVKSVLNNYENMTAEQVAQAFVGGFLYSFASGLTTDVAAYGYKGASILSGKQNAMGEQMFNSANWTEVRKLSKKANAEKTRKEINKTRTISPVDNNNEKIITEELDKCLSKPAYVKDKYGEDFENVFGQYPIVKVGDVLKDADDNVIEVNGVPYATVSYLNEHGDIVVDIAPANGEVEGHRVAIPNKVFDKTNKDLADIYSVVYQNGGDFGGLTEENTQNVNNDAETSEQTEQPKTEKKYVNGMNVVDEDYAKSVFGKPEDDGKTYDERAKEAADYRKNLDIDAELKRVEAEFEKANAELNNAEYKSSDYNFWSVKVQELIEEYRALSALKEQQESKNNTKTENNAKPGTSSQKESVSEPSATQKVEESSKTENKVKENEIVKASKKRATVKEEGVTHEDKQKARKQRQKDKKNILTDKKADTMPQKGTVSNGDYSIDYEKNSLPLRNGKTSYNIKVNIGGFTIESTVRASSDAELNEKLNKKLSTILEGANEGSSKDKSAEDTSFDFSVEDEDEILTRIENSSEDELFEMEKTETDEEVLELIDYEIGRRIKNELKNYQSNPNSFNAYKLSGQESKETPETDRKRKNAIAFVKSIFDKAKEVGNEAEDKARETGVVNTDRKTRPFVPTIIDKPKTELDYDFSKKTEHKPLGNINDPQFTKQKEALERAKKADEEKKKSAKEKENIDNFVNHSGGAVGSDTEWGEIGEEYGVKSKHYYYGESTPNGNTKLFKSDFEEGFNHALIAAKSLGKKISKFSQAGKLIARNWFQVKNADEIFAVGKVNANTNQVDGGTGWAVQMAVDNNKPIHVFDINTNKWMQYDYETKTFVETDTPTLTKNFAGIGTREITDAGKQAIRDVYDKTFGEKDNLVKDDDADFTGRMSMEYKGNQRSDISSTSTFEAIEKGERTATTRNSSWKGFDQWLDAKEGQTITWIDKDDNRIRVKLTEDAIELFYDKEKNAVVDKDGNILTAKEWSKEEGWAEDQFDKYVLNPLLEGKRVLHLRFNTETEKRNYFTRDKNEIKKDKKRENSLLKRFHKRSKYGTKGYAEENTLSKSAKAAKDEVAFLSTPIENDTDYTVTDKNTFNKNSRLGVNGKDMVDAINSGEKTAETFVSNGEAELLALENAQTYDTVTLKNNGKETKVRLTSDARVLAIDKDGNVYDTKTGEIITPSKWSKETGYQVSKDQVFYKKSGLTERKIIENTFEEKVLNPLKNGKKVIYIQFVNPEIISAMDAKLKEYYSEGDMERLFEGVSPKYADWLAMNDSYGMEADEKAYEPKKERYSGKAEYEESEFDNEDKKYTQEQVLKDTESKRTARGTSSPIIKDNTEYKIDKLNDNNPLGIDTSLEYNDKNLPPRRREEFKLRDRLMAKLANKLLTRAKPFVKSAKAAALHLFEENKNSNITNRYLNSVSAEAKNGKYKKGDKIFVLVPEAAKGIGKSELIKMQQEVISEAFAAMRNGASILTESDSEIQYDNKYANDFNSGRRILYSFLAEGVKRGEIVKKVHTVEGQKHTVEVNEWSFKDKDAQTFDFVDNTDDQNDLINGYVSELLKKGAQSKDKVPFNFRGFTVSFKGNNIVADRQDAHYEFANDNIGLRQLAEKLLEHRNEPFHFGYKQNFYDVRSALSEFSDIRLDKPGKKANVIDKFKISIISDENKDINLYPISIYGDEYEVGIYKKEGEDKLHYVLIDSNTNKQIIDEEFSNNERNLNTLAGDITRYLFGYTNEDTQISFNFPQETWADRHGKKNNLINNGGKPNDLQRNNGENKGSGGLDSRNVSGRSWKYNGQNNRTTIQPQSEKYEKSGERNGIKINTVKNKDGVEYQTFTVGDSTYETVGVFSKENESKGVKKLREKFGRFVEIIEVDSKFKRNGKVSAGTSVVGNGKFVIIIARNRNGVYADTLSGEAVNQDQVFMHEYAHQLFIAIGKDNIRNELVKAIGEDKLKELSDKLKSKKGYTNASDNSILSEIFARMMTQSKLGDVDISELRYKFLKSESARELIKQAAAYFSKDMPFSFGDEDIEYGNDADQIINYYLDLRIEETKTTAREQFEKTGEEEAKKQFKNEYDATKQAVDELNNTKIFVDSDKDFMLTNDVTGKNKKAFEAAREGLSKLKKTISDVVSGTADFSELKSVVRDLNDDDVCKTFLSDAIVRQIKKTEKYFNDLKDSSLSDEELEYSKEKYAKEMRRTVQMINKEIKDVNRIHNEQGKIAKLATENGRKFDKNFISWAYSKYLRFQISSGNAFSMLGGYKKYENNFGYKLKAKHERAVRVKLKTMVEANNILEEISSKLSEDFINNKTLELDGQKIIVDGQEIGVQTAIAMIMSMETLSDERKKEDCWKSYRVQTLNGFCVGEGKFIDISNMKPEQIKKLYDNLNKALPAEAREYMEKSREMFEFFRPLIMDAYERTFGTDLDMQEKGRYFPIDYRADKEGSFENAFDIYNDYTRTQLDNKRTFERTLDHGGFVYAQTASEIVEKYIEKMSSFVAFSEYSKELNNLNRENAFGNTIVKSMRDGFGNEFGDWMAEYIKDVSLTTKQSRTDADHAVNSLISKLNGMLARGALKYSVSVPLKQISSYWTGIGPLSAASVAKAYSLAEVIPGRADKDKALLLKSRYKGDFVKSVNDRINPEKGMKLITAMDAWTINRLYDACEIEIDSKYGDSITESKRRELVDELFDEVVLNSQPIYLKEARPEIARTESATLKSTAMFRTQALQNFNRMLTAIEEYRANGKGEHSEEVTKNLVRTVFGQSTAAMSLSLISILVDLALHRWKKYKDDDDETLSASKITSRFFKNFLINGASTAWFGDAAMKKLIDVFNSATGNKDAEKEYYGISYGAISTLLDVYDGVTDVIKTPTLYNYKKVAGNLATATGIPLNNIYNILNSAVMTSIDIVGSDYNMGDYDDLLKMVEDNVNPEGMNDEMKGFYKNKAIQYAIEGNKKSFEVAKDKLVRKEIADQKEKNAKNGADVSEEKVKEESIANVNSKLAKEITDKYLLDAIDIDKASKLLVDVCGMPSEKAAKKKLEKAKANGDFSRFKELNPYLDISQKEYEYYIENLEGNIDVYAYDAMLSDLDDLKEERETSITYNDDVIKRIDEENLPETARDKYYEEYLGTTYKNSYNMLINAGISKNNVPSKIREIDSNNNNDFSQDEVVAWAKENPTDENINLLVAIANSKGWTSTQWQNKLRKAKIKIS